MSINSLRSVGCSKAINMVVIKIMLALDAASSVFLFLFFFYINIIAENYELNELPGRNLRQGGLKLAGYESLLQLS